MDGEHPQSEVAAAILEALSGITFSSGKGLLDARALWAAVVGPHRLAMAQGKSVELGQEDPEQIAQNIGAADALKFVGVALPFDATAVPLATIFSREAQLGKNASAPYNLNGQMGGGGFGPTGFMQLLLPGEQLYALIAPVGGAPTSQRVVVAEVVF